MTTSNPLFPKSNDRCDAEVVQMGSEILDRAERAVLKVRERLLRVTNAFNQAGIPYAVVGGNAVAYWVATADQGAVRNTPDVNVLIRRKDLPVIAAVLAQVGFVAGQSTTTPMFHDGEDSKPREAVKLLFAGEQIRANYLLPAPDIKTVNDPAGFGVIELEQLVLMKLLAHRRIDRVHLRDLISVGLIDSTWPARFAPELAERLQHLLDTPDG